MAELGPKLIVSIRHIALIAASFAAIGSLSGSDTTPAAASPNAAERAFSRLKGLTGQWEARAPELYGNAVVRLSYRLVSDDSVLVETFTIEDEAVEMITMYHLDGEQLALTHYCAVNNQVRMLADLPAKAGPAADSQRITFEFRDGSNLESSHLQVMNRLGVVFEDEDHFTQEWHWRDEKSPSGQDSAVYRYTRVR